MDGARTRRPGQVGQPRGEVEERLVPAWAGGSDEHQEEDGGAETLLARDAADHGGVDLLMIDVGTERMRTAASSSWSHSG